MHRKTLFTHYHPYEIKCVNSIKLNRYNNENVTLGFHHKHILILHIISYGQYHFSPHGFAI